MGRRWYDKFLIRDMSKLWPFKVEYDPENYRCMVLANYRCKEELFSPEEISSMILMKMREIAEAYLGATIRNAVISVPAHFNTAQRQATMDAGVIAGLNVMRLINEPSSAALAYGFDRNVGREGKKNVIIFDLGGGTLDVSLLKIGWGTFKVMSTAGDAYLGGEDFEETIVNHCIEEFKKKHSVDIGGNFRAVRRLKAACEKAKIVLSVTNQATIEIDCLYEEIDFSSTITRAQFVKLSSHLLRKCRETVERCLMEAKVSPRSIDEVLLVGGSTRMPMVQDMLRSYFSKELCKAVNADQAVAYGATLQAAMLTYCEGNEEAPTLVLEDVSPLDLRVLVDRTNQTTMCRKNTAIPPKHGLKIPFHQYMEDSLDVYEDGHLLGTLSGCYNYVIWGHLVIDENGMWSALVLDGNTNQEIKAAIPMGRLNEQEIQRMVQEAEECNFQDKAHKKKVDQEKNSLEKFVYDVRQAISDKKMEDKPQKNIEAAIEKVIEWLSSIPLIELKDCKEKMVELHAVHQPILSKNHKEAEKENNDSSPYGDAAPSASANDVHSSSCVVCKPKAVQAHSDNITESNFASSISGGASGTVESKIICHPKIDAKKVSHGREAGLEFAVAKSYFSDGTTSKLEIRFPNSDSKVEITSEMKVMTNFNHLDRSHLHRILSEVGRWAHDMGLDTYNQISCMLNAKIESNNSSTGDGADSASDGLSPLC